MKIGNKEHKTVTLELLKKLNACEEGLDFLRRNKLEGFPLSRLHEIEGDYDGFVSWLKKTLEVARDWQYEYDKDGNVTKIMASPSIIAKYEYDQNGNMTKEVDSDGFFTEIKYDQNGNMIEQVSASGRTTEYKYDQNGNMIEQVSASGRTTEFEYDKDGNVTKVVEADGYVWLYELDSKGNTLVKANSDGHVWKYESSFYPDGQLKSYGSLKIPFFEKPSESS